MDNTLKKKGVIKKNKKENKVEDSSGLKLYADYIEEGAEIKVIGKGDFAITYPNGREQIINTLGLGGEGAKAGTVGSGRGTGKINLQSNPGQPQRTANLLVDFGRVRVHRVHFLRQWQLHALVPHAKPRYDTRRGGGGTGLDLWDLRRSGYVYGRVFSR